MAVGFEDDPQEDEENGGPKGDRCAPGDLKDGWKHCVEWTGMGG